MKTATAALLAACLMAMPAIAQETAETATETAPTAEAMPGSDSASESAAIETQSDSETSAENATIETTGDRTRPAPEVVVAPAGESDCGDRMDNDGDYVVDCADADCFSDALCQEDGEPESSDQRCSDWVDNDGDGAMDCEDTECTAANITVCQGSWQLQTAPTPAASPVGTGYGMTSAAVTDGKSLEDLIGGAGDLDGERNDYVCSDGIDNDGDGRTDCADVGCQADSSVTVCQGTPDLRFSVVGAVAASYEIETVWGADSPYANPNTTATPDANFERLQLRALGPIPFIQDSFFLISSRAEKDFRITFAFFQVPIKGTGHTVNINSGGGGLSQGLIISAAKQLLGSQPYYLYNNFEAGNGAAAELAGPLTQNGKLRYRTFVGMGSGRWSGSLGGRYYGEGYNNFTYTAGAQLGLNLIGYFSRFDTPFLYRPVPLTWGVLVGAKFDQRNDEQFVAGNIHSTLRYRRFIFSTESYAKHDRVFDFYGLSYNATIGFLAIPKKVMLAADYGWYRIFGLENTGTEIVSAIDELDRERPEFQWRLAAHYFFYRNIGVLSLLYSQGTRQIQPLEDYWEFTQELRLEAQYRF